MSSRKTASASKTVPGSSPLVDHHQPVQQHTPPPDTYSNIKPCSHVKSVLDTKAKDTVFVTYRQAVEISQSATSDRTYSLKKDGSIISQSKLIDLKSNSIKCTSCSLGNFYHNFICLQCPHVGCFNDKNHAYSHYKSNQHLFGIDAHNGLLYCFLCGDYINHPELEKIRLEVLTGKSSQKQKLLSDEEIALHYNDPTSKSIHGLKGFVNLGSTCFMSCILQTLMHNPIVKYQIFNNDFHYFNCKSVLDYENGEVDESNACITCSIDDLFKNFYTSNTKDGFGMTNLLLTAWYKQKSLAGFQEQDAHEFWQFLINEFHSDYERIQSLAGEDVPEPCECISHMTFSGELESSIKCSSCESRTRTVDPMVDISLEIPKLKKKDIDLYDCFNRFTKEESLDLLYECQYCGNKAKATKSLKIKKFPAVLSLQLKRFEHNIYNDTASKLEDPVHVPLYLNLTKFSSESEYNEAEIEGDKIFELFALVYHIGSVNTGHYVVVIKNDNGQWLKFDDSVITLVSQKEVSMANAYLLFYITHKI